MHKKGLSFAEFYIMKSITDFEKKWNEQTPITELAKNARGKIFYDTYPLSSNVNREEFEINILNHFIRERINFPTVTSFKIALITKLREIMPKYNLMFDLLAKDLELFNTNTNRDLTENTDDDHILSGSKNSEENGEYSKQGDKNSKENGTYSKIGDGTEEGETENIHTSTDVLEKTTETESKEDLRESDTPQNQLADIKNGSYVSKYNYNEREGTETVNSTDTVNATDNGTSSKTTHSTDDGEDERTYGEVWHENGTDKTTYGEQTGETGERDISHILNEKFKSIDNLVAKMQMFNEIPHIMSMIYDDLDCLFLQVFDY